MRMWNVDPRMMCAKHLLGEHVELHMMVGALRKGKSIAGFLEKKLMAVHLISSRHAALVAEMTARGYKHASPLPSFRSSHLGAVDAKANLIELARRCPACRARIQRGQ